MSARIDERGGFSLLEITVVLALLMAAVLITGTIYINSLNAWETQEAAAQLNSTFRDVSGALVQELGQASLQGVDSATPPVTGVALVLDPPGVGFQRPLNPQGTAWTPRITFRLYNEDLNGNLRLDAGEDTNNNGVLDRVLERLEDVDGDGVFLGPEEVRRFGRHLTLLELELQDSMLNVRLGASVRSPRKEITLTDTQAFAIHIRN